MLDEIGEVQARNPIISTLAEGQRRIDEDFREGVPVVDRIGAPFRAVQQGRNSIDIWNFGCKLGSGSGKVLGQLQYLTWGKVLAQILGQKISIELYPRPSCATSSAPPLAGSCSTSPARSTTAHKSDPPYLNPT